MHTQSQDFTPNMMEKLEEAAEAVMIGMNEENTWYIDQAKLLVRFVENHVPPAASSVLFGDKYQHSDQFIRSFFNLIQAIHDCFNTDSPHMKVEMVRAHLSVLRAAHARWRQEVRELEGIKA